MITLSGCVRYDVNINFHDVNNGTMIQQIKLSEQLTNLSQGESNIWLKNLQNQAKKVDAKIKKISAEELELIIPFNNGEDLVEKFNQLFTTKIMEKSVNSLDQVDFISLSDFNTKMAITQSNFLFFERNIINFQADLTPFGVPSNNGNIIISSGDLISLQINFNFPWGAKLTTNDYPQWEKLSNQNYNISLKAGQLNEFKAVFWLPNYIGFGSFFILVFILLGYYLKYQKLPFVPN